MKFILNQKGSKAVNAAFIKRISLSVERTICGENDEWYEVFVTAELEDDSVLLRKFDSKDKDKNISAAKAYLAELVADLNGGAK